MEPLQFRLKTKFSQELLSELRSVQQPYIDSLMRELTSKSSQPQKSVSGVLKINLSFLMPSVPECAAILRSINDVQVEEDSHFERSTSVGSNNSSGQQVGNYGYREWLWFIVFLLPARPLF